MTYTFTCFDLGMDFKHEIEGNNIGEVMKKVIVHQRRFHNFTESQLKDPEIINAIKSEIKPKDKK